jgi:histidine triad (HIT) family protein
MTVHDCIFCKIIAGEIPAPHLAANSDAIAIADIAPVAPTHYLILPRKHQENAVALHRSAPEQLGALFALVDELTLTEGISDYRLVFNTGAEAGQSVFHAHLHLLAGRAFTWPPG